VWHSSGSLDLRHTSMSPLLRSTRAFPQKQICEGYLTDLELISKHSTILFAAQEMVKYYAAQKRDQIDNIKCDTSPRSLGAYLSDHPQDAGPRTEYTLEVLCG